MHSGLRVRVRHLERPTARRRPDDSAGAVVPAACACGSHRLVHVVVARRLARRLVGRVELRHAFHRDVVQRVAAGLLHCAGRTGLERHVVDGGGHVLRVLGDLNRAAVAADDGRGLAVARSYTGLLSDVALRTGMFVPRDLPRRLISTTPTAARQVKSASTTTMMAQDVPLSSAAEPSASTGPGAAVVRAIVLLLPPSLPDAAGPGTEAASVAGLPLPPALSLVAAVTAAMSSAALGLGHGDVSEQGTHATAAVAVAVASATRPPAGHRRSG